MNTKDFILDCVHKARGEERSEGMRKAEWIVGIVEETGELLSAQTQEDRILEFGDLCFYCVMWLHDMSALKDPPGGGFVQVMDDILDEHGVPWKDSIGGNDYAKGYLLMRCVLGLLGGWKKQVFHGHVENSAKRTADVKNVLGQAIQFMHECSNEDIIIEDVYELNVAKRLKRYGPSGFSKKASQERNLFQAVSNRAVIPCVKPSRRAAVELRAAEKDDAAKAVWLHKKVGIHCDRCRNEQV